MLLGNYLHTVRHLRPSQIRGQIRVRLRRFFVRTHDEKGSAISAYPGCRWNPRNPIHPPTTECNSREQLRAGRFRFQNEALELGWPPAWDRATPSRLWEYNLHYFDWIWALDYHAARESVADWITRIQPCEKHTGWESYPVSLRLMNWSGFFFQQHLVATESDSEFLNTLWRSLHRQAEWISQRLETHLAGNHLLENAAALAWIGTCFNGTKALTWRNLGVALLKKELPEQLPADGMHFERSPMYHLRATYLLQELENLGDEDLQTLVMPYLARARNALRKLIHPDTQIALLNDSAVGVYDLHSGLDGETVEEEACRKQEIGCWSLPNAGYYGWRDTNGNYLVCDAGAIGPDYIPGHAHADILSFELSLNGKRVIVDAGVYDYEIGEMRDWCRSTRAHNTVEIAGQDQCEMWGAFRVARRGYPREVRWEQLEDGFALEAWHDGYRRLPGRPIHKRQIQWSSSGCLVVTDMVSSKNPVRATVRFHLHPDCQIESLKDREAIVAFDAGRFCIRCDAPNSLETEESWYCPEFGVRMKNTSIILSMVARESYFHTVIELIKD